MNQGFKDLTNKNRKISCSAKLKNNLLGYIRAMEVTYNSDEDTYHPHIHCIFALKAGYFTHGYIKIRLAIYLGWVLRYWIWTNRKSSDDKNSTAKAVAEVAKYPVKMDELANYDNEKKAINALIVFTKILKGRRLITFGGVFADIKKTAKTWRCWNRRFNSPWRWSRANL